MIRCRKKFYPVEWVDEITWLQHCASEIKVDVIIIQATNDLDMVKKACLQRQYLRYLNAVSLKDLYGLEQIWQSTSPYSPLLSQKDYTQMLKCNRSSLNRHYSALLSAHNTSLPADNASALESVTGEFSWQTYTEHIPSLPADNPVPEVSDTYSDK